MEEQNTVYDSIVVGVGGIGSAAMYHLARRGHDVLGLDQHNIPNSIGSSHGDSRLIRLTNYENPEYVPHVRRSLKLWEDLEEEYGEQLLFRTGTVDAGREDSETVEGSLKACKSHGLSYEYLSSTELSQKFRGFDLPKEFKAVYQPDGGFINPTKSVQAHVQGAHANGAEAHAHETVARWETTEDRVFVDTDVTTYEAEHLVLTAGAWTSVLPEELQETLTPWRVIVGGFQPSAPEKFSPEAMPVFSIDDEESSYYGAPMAGTSGFKFGLVDNLEDVAEPDGYDPKANDKEIDRLRSVLHPKAQEYFPEGAFSTKRLKTCMVTHTPDHDFIVDSMPSDPKVTVGVGFSGKGFKFSCLMGELLADQVTREPSEVNVEMFSVERF